MKTIVLSRQLKSFPYLIAMLLETPKLQPEIFKLANYEISNKFKDDGRKTQKTHEKYLALLGSKITAPNTIYTYIEYFRKLSKSIHMKYVNITLDIRVAMNTRNFLWEDLEQFFNVITHSGNFHNLKGLFKVIPLLNDDLFSSAK